MAAGVGLIERNEQITSWVGGLHRNLKGEITLVGENGESSSIIAAPICVLNQPQILSDLVQMLNLEDGSLIDFGEKPAMFISRRLLRELIESLGADINVNIQVLDSLIDKLNENPFGPGLLLTSRDDFVIGCLEYSPLFAHYFFQAFGVNLISPRIAGSNFLEAPEV